MIDLYNLSTYLPLILYSIATIIPFLVALYLLKQFYQNYLLKKTSRQNIYIVTIIYRIASLTILYISIVTLFGTLGININGLLAGLGLTGFAVGFALRDVLASIISTLLILFYKPFQIGSIIKVLDVEGEVIDIDMRYISIASDGLVHLIPSAKLLSEKVVIYKNKKI